MTREEFYKLTDILNTEVLGNFMHGGEADELIAMFEEAVEHSNIIEVKEVDLEKEYEEFVVDDPILGNFITNDTMGMELAKHFFELGLKAQKGE
jgi:hypothetical protein